MSLPLYGISLIVATWNFGIALAARPCGLRKRTDFSRVITLACQHRPHAPCVFTLNYPVDFVLICDH